MPVRPSAWIIVPDPVDEVADHPAVSDAIFVLAGEAILTRQGRPGGKALPGGGHEEYHWPLLRPRLRRGGSVLDLRPWIGTSQHRLG